MTFDDLPEHEGSVRVRLPGGRLRTEEDGTPGGQPVPGEGVLGYRATCSCGWAAPSDHPPTEVGEMLASSDWAAHVKPLLATAPPRWLLNRSESLRHSVAELASTWPLQALGVLADIERWQKPLIDRAVASAREAGTSWAEIGAALGIAKQSAHERFGPTARRRPGGQSAAG